MSTEQQRQQWRELAAVLGKYAEPAGDERFEARDAITALLADVDAVEARADALAAELERVRAQLDAVPVEGEVSIPTGKPQPTQDENSKAEFRIKRIDAMYAQYGNDRNTWPWPAQETFAKLDAAQTEYEAKYC